MGLIAFIAASIVGVIAHNTLVRDTGKPQSENTLPSEILTRRRERVSRLYKLSLSDKNHAKVAQATHILRMIDIAMLRLNSSKHRFKYD